MRYLQVLVVTVCFGLAVFCVGASAQEGALAPLAGSSGCIYAGSSTTSGCASAPRRFLDSQAVTVSRDGSRVFVLDGQGSITAYPRNPSANGALNTAGTSCISNVGLDGCDRMQNLRYAYDIALTPDGRSAYVVSAGSSGVTGIEGVLTTLDTSSGSLRLSAHSPSCQAIFVTGCASTWGVVTARAVAASNDFVAVAAPTRSSVSVFRRDSSGSLSEVGCVADSLVHHWTAATCGFEADLQSPADVAFSPDGRKLAVAVEGTGLIVIYRVGNDGTLARVGSSTLRGARTVEFSPDGKNLYAASTSANQLNTFSLSSDGALTTAGTASVSTPNGIAISPDGKNAYVSGGQLVTYRRDTASGALLRSDCHASALPCRVVRSLENLKGVTVSPDGLNVYTIGSYLEPDTGGYSYLSAFSREQAPPPVRCADPTEPGCTPDRPVRVTSTSAAPPVQPPMPPKPPNKCEYFEKGSRSAFKAVSAWKMFKDTTRVRLMTREGGSILRSGDKATFTLQTRGIEGRKSTVRAVSFSIDGKKVAQRSGAPFVVTINPRDYAVGTHKLTAIAYSKSGKKAKVEIPFAGRDCRLPAILASMSSKLRRAHPNLLLKAYSGGPQLATVNFGVPRAIRVNIKRRLLGKAIGTLKLTDVGGAETGATLRLPRSLTNNLVLLDRNGLKVEFQPKGSNPTVKVSGLPENVTGVSVALKGTKTRMFRNVDSCEKLSYRGSMTARNGSSTTQKRFTALCSTLR